MIERIEQWIDTTNRVYLPQRKSCAIFAEEFRGYFSLDFLEQAGFVLVDIIPKPVFPQLRELSIDELLNLEPDGITYKQTYYLLHRHERNLRLHFHELVHVAQWQFLGAGPFIRRYISEIQRCGYRGSPLEMQACELEGRYLAGPPVFNALEAIRQRLAAE